MSLTHAAGMACADAGAGGVPGVAPSVLVVSVTQGRGHGAEAVGAELIAALGEGPFPLHVLAPTGSGMAGPGRGCAVLPSSRDALVCNVRAARRVCRRDLPRVGLVHAWTARAFEVALLLARRLGCPFSGTLHDHPRAGFHGALRRWLMRRCAAGMAGLVCVSDAVRAACVEAGYACPLHVVHNGLRDLPAAPSVAVRDKINIGFVGTYVPWKGFGMVRELVERQGLDANWHLYGVPCRELQADVAALARRFPAVTVHGWCPPRSIFERMDVLFHPSDQFDPLPTALIEAARQGVAAVASAVGGTREIVEPGTTGWLFARGNVAEAAGYLRQLCVDAGLRRRMGCAARLRYERHFRVERMAESYAELWRRIMQ